MSGDIIVTPASDREIIAWWDWASKFTKGSSPFQTGWGRGGVDRNNQNQPNNVFVFCLSCTAGTGGADNEPRPLKSAKESGRSILVPIYVAGSEESATVAETLLGNRPHKIEFLINGNKPSSFYNVDGNPNSSFYRETSVGPLEFVEDNSFDEEARVFPVYYSAGYWAKITSSIEVDNLQFGGTGGKQVEYIMMNGRKTSNLIGEFVTTVRYES